MYAVTKGERGKYAVTQGEMKIEKETEVLTLRVPSAMVDELEALAGAENVTKSQLVRMAIALSIENMRKHDNAKEEGRRLLSFWIDNGTAKALLEACGGDEEDLGDLLTTLLQGAISGFMQWAAGERG